MSPWRQSGVVSGVLGSQRRDQGSRLTHTHQAESVYDFAHAFPFRVPLPLLTQPFPCQSHLILYNLA